VRSGAVRGLGPAVRDPRRRLSRTLKRDVVHGMRDTEGNERRPDDVREECPPAAMRAAPSALPATRPTPSEPAAQAGRRRLQWHGATPTTPLTHIAIQEALDGKFVNWMEKVTNEQYRTGEVT